jgi:hypothetical protein
MLQGVSKYRPERGGLAVLHTTVCADTRSWIDRRAKGRFGTARARGRVVDEELMSRPYEPTEEQKSEPVCIRAYVERCTEAETIERMFAELRCRPVPQEHHVDSEDLG